jgi:hypothetical protein
MKCWSVTLNADRNYQDLIDRIDYFKELNVNALHLMPVMDLKGTKAGATIRLFTWPLISITGLLISLKN